MLNLQKFLSRVPSLTVVLALGLLFQGSGFAQEARSDTSSVFETVSARGAKVTVNLPRKSCDSQVSLSDPDLSQYNPDLPGPSDPTYNYQLFVAAIQKVRQTSAAKLNIPRGKYVIQKPSTLPSSIPEIDFSNLQDVTVEGNNSMLLFMNMAEGIAIGGSAQRLLVQDLVLDWGIPLAFPGYVQLDEHGVPVFQPVSGYPIDPNAPPVLTVVEEFDIQNKTWPHRPSLFSIRHVTGGLANRNITGTPPTYNAANDAFYFDSADTLALQNALKIGGPQLQAIGTVRTGLHAVDVKGNSSNITLNNLTVYTSPGMAFIVRTSGQGFHIVRCQDIRNPADPSRMISSLADALNISNGGNVIIESNVFANQEDDGLNLHGLSFAVTDIAAETAQSASITVSPGFRPNFLVGDQVELVQQSDYQTLLTAHIAQIAPPSCQNGVCSYQYTLDQPFTGANTGLFLIDLSNSAPNFIVMRNQVHDNYAHGLVIQGRNGIVIQNHIENTLMAGIALQGHISLWLEGPGAQNVLVAENLIDHSNLGVANRYLSYPLCGSPLEPLGYEAGLEVDARIPGGISQDIPLSNIWIVNNTIQFSPGLGILISAASDVAVLDNRVLAANLQPFASAAIPGCSGTAAQGSIYVTHANNVIFKGNVRSGDSTQGLSVDASTTANITTQSQYPPLSPIPYGVMSFSPSLCIITSGQSTCSSVLTWSTWNAPNACIFAYGATQPLACGTQGQMSVSGINRTSRSFLLRTRPDPSSPEIFNAAIRGVVGQWFPGFACASR